jgi:hypothetical protein
VTTGISIFLFVLALESRLLLTVRDIVSLILSLVYAMAVGAIILVVDFGVLFASALLAFNILDALYLFYKAKKKVK